MDGHARGRVVLGAVALGAACLLAVGVLLGGSPREQAAADALPVVSHALGGTVIDARTGEPLPDVVVEVRGGGREWAVLATSDTDGTFDTVVDGTGLFPPGETPTGAGPAVDVRLSLPGFGTRTVRDWPLPTGSGDQPPVRLDGADHDDPAHDLGLRRVP